MQAPETVLTDGVCGTIRVLAYPLKYGNALYFRVVMYALYENAVGI